LITKDDNCARKNCAIALPPILFPKMTKFLRLNLNELIIPLNQSLANQSVADLWATTLKTPEQSPILPLIIWHEAPIHNRSLVPIDNHCVLKNDPKVHRSAIAPGKAEPIIVVVENATGTATGKHLFVSPL
jgi:hypothetical protein